jgi:glycosyltransferase involved in cell wall biosynthesis
MMLVNSDITVIIATYNRAQELARTLERIAKAEKRGLGVEVVVADNGSTDSTREVVGSFCDRISVQYIFEARSGKNRALNAALEKTTLRNIVVFTDDDVDVPPDWLTKIAETCERWPNHSIFGGRINVIFPRDTIPKWALDPYASSLAFARHHYSNQECVYEEPETPFGPNFWVKKEIFETGRRFNEAIGPHPSKGTLGDETLFFLSLLEVGYEIVYTPKVVVGHRVQPQTLRFSSVCARAYRLGRGKANFGGPPQKTLLTKYPALWSTYRRGAITWNVFNLLFSTIFSSNEKRLNSFLSSITNIGYQVETIRIAKYGCKIKSQDNLS